MKVCGCVSLAALLWCAPAAAQPVVTIEQAIHEAVDHNLSLLAERLNITVADAAIVTARLRPNPVLSGGANSLDWLGTGFNDVNNAGPPEVLCARRFPVRARRQAGAANRRGEHGEDRRGSAAGRFDPAADAGCAPGGRRRTRGAGQAASGE